MKKISFFYIYSLIASFSSTSSESSIIIDGNLNETKWENTAKNTYNYQVSPQTFKEVHNNFSYKYFTTEQGIFLGIKAAVKNELRVRTQENDKLFTNDHLQIMLDMNNTKQTSYVFSVNHQNNYFDGIYKQDKELDLDWNAIWEYEVNHKDDFWVAEIYIPWSSMSFSSRENTEFGLFISRFDEATNATYANTPANPSMNSFLQHFSKEKAVIQSNSSFDIYPYISLNRDIIDNNNSFGMGAEIFWKPTKNQQLSVTLKPDFGQVESDELVVNFSSIESFFSEKRPFFNENQSIFEVSGPENLRVVHTPRIAGNAYYDSDYNGELESAFKYTYGNEFFDLGLLSAHEDSLTDTNGRDFLSMRGQYRFGENKLGVSLNHIETPSITRNAIIFSADFLYSYSENTEFNLGIINSNIKQGVESLNDVGWWMTGSSEYSINHNHEFSIFVYGDDLQLNDIGYVKRINRKQVEYEYEYQIPALNLWSIRDIAFVLETEIKTNYQNEKLPYVLGAGIELLTQREFEYQLYFEHGTSGFDDLSTRGHNSVWLPSFNSIEVDASSPEYLWGKLGLKLELGTEGFDGKFYNIESSIDQQFNDNTYITFTMYQYNSDSWISWKKGNFIKEYDFTEQGVEISIDYKLSENQELRLKFESVIGKAEHKADYKIELMEESELELNSGNFSFAENAFQLRYKYSLSKLTALYISYSFGGELEGELAKFNRGRLYKKVIETKDEHNIFAKLRFHF